MPKMRWFVLQALQTPKPLWAWLKCRLEDNVKVECCVCLQSTYLAYISKTYGPNKTYLQAKFGLYHPCNCIGRGEVDFK